MYRICFVLTKINFLFIPTINLSYYLTNRNLSIIFRRYLVNLSTNALLKLQINHEFRILSRNASIMRTELY